MITFLQFITEGIPTPKKASDHMHELVRYDADDRGSPQFYHSDKGYQKINIEHIKSTQSKINNHKVEKIKQSIKNGKDVEPPELVHHKGEYGIQDGHHRIEARIRNGEKHILAHVTDVKVI